MALRSNNKPKKIILTTDQDLIKDGIQAIDDEFLEWFIKNPNCEKVKIEIEPLIIQGESDYFNYDNGKKLNKNAGNYKIIIPKEEKCIYCENKGYIENHTGSSKIDCLQCNIIKEEPKTNLEKLPFPELVEELARYYNSVPLIEDTKKQPTYSEKEEPKQDRTCSNNCSDVCGECQILQPKQETLEEVAESKYGIGYGAVDSINAFIEGAKWQQEQDKNKYSEEDMTNYALYILHNNIITPKQWLKQFKKK